MSSALNKKSKWENASKVIWFLNNTLHFLNFFSFVSDNKHYVCLCFSLFYPIPIESRNACIIILNCDFAEKVKCTMKPNSRTELHFYPPSIEVYFQHEVDEKPTWSLQVTYRQNTENIKINIKVFNQTEKNGRNVTFAPHS